MDILVGILFVILGLTLATSGLRVFFAVLPIVGFISGFGVGATSVTAWLGDGFLSTATGWIVGIILGLVFAFFSYMYWYIGALLAAGSAGALLLSGLFSAFGVNTGWLLFIIGLIGAIVFIFAAMVLKLPMYVVLVNTAILGAYVTIAGLLLVFNRKDLENFDWGVARAATHDSWLWWLVLVVVAVVGIMSQLSMVARVQLPADYWVKADTESRN